MPDESQPNRPASNTPAPPESSLADLLPEFFETSQPAQPAAVEPLATNDPLLVPVQMVPVKPQRKGFNYVPLIIVAVVGMVIVPLVILGVFIFIANNQPAQTTIDVASATTPLPTVFSITPGAATTTAPAANGTTQAGTTKASPGATTAAKSPAPTANPCPPRTAFGSVELYTCSQAVQVNSTFTSFVGLAEVQVAQSGQNGPAANRVYLVSGDSPAKVMQFYATSLAAQGFAPVKTNETGSTSLGAYTSSLYVKDNQQVQILALTVNKASPDGQVNAGQTLIRLSSS